MKPSLRGSIARTLLAVLAISISAQPVIASTTAATKGSSSTTNSIYVKAASNSQVTFKVDLNDKYRRQTAVFRVSRIISNKPSNLVLGSVKLDNYGIGLITKKFKVVKNDIFQVLVANKLIAQAKLPLTFKSSFTLLKLYVASISPAVALPFVSPTPSAEPKSEPTPSASPAPTPSSTPAAIPTPTASPEPTPTASPTPTPTPTPTVTPTQSAAPVSPPSGGGGGGTPPAPPAPTSSSTPAADQTIDIRAIAGVTAPVAGATPVDSVTATAEYTGTVTWSPTASPTFAHGMTYTATITLAPKSGFTLTGITADTFTVAGATSVHNSVDSGVITAIFPATSLTTVGNFAIAGVTAPVAGATPVSTITETPEYTGTVTWSPAASPTFSYSQVYTATITLAAKSGYTFDGVAADTFTVTGATPVHNLVNAGVVTATFPATGNPSQVTDTTINDIVPVAGLAPVVSINNSQYTGLISWTSSGGSVGTYFDTATVYTAVIHLTATSGNTFVSVGHDFTIGGATSSTTTYGTDTATVTAEFPATVDLIPLTTPIPTASTSLIGVTFTSVANSGSYTAKIYDHAGGICLATVNNYVSGTDLLTYPESIAAHDPIASALALSNEVDVTITAVANLGSGYQNSAESTKAQVSQPS